MICYRNITYLWCDFEENGNMKRIKLLFFAIVLSLGSLIGQDQHFTQFYASPLSLNPALTGAFDGKFRVSFIYRDQWRNALDNPYVTYSAAIDLRFRMGYANKKGKDAFGVGMLFYSDVNGGIDFTTNQINISSAFHKSLSKSGEQYLSLGVQAGIAQRAISYENLTFDDQFNGSNGYSDPTFENLPENNFSFTDYAVGLNYSFTPKNRMAVFAGLSLHHILEPQIGFFYDPDNEENNLQHNLHRKYSGYLSLQLPIGERIQLLPRAMFYNQGPHMAINAGSNIRFLISDIRGVALHLGGWARPVKDVDQSLSMDAVVGMVGIEYENFLLGISYDAHLNDLTLSRGSQSAIEISIAYLGEYENETIQCPKF